MNKLMRGINVTAASLRSKGFTLIETLMVIVVLGIVGSGLLLYFTSMRSSGDPVIIVQAASLAQESIERVIADARAGNFAGVVATLPAVLPAPFDKFTRETQVICVNEATLDTEIIGDMPACATSNIIAKRVRVIVSWTGNSTDYVTIISNH